MTWVVIASGQSLSQDHVSAVYRAKKEGRISGVGAISNVAKDLAPWADFVASHDSNWWKYNRPVLNLSMRKFCRMHVAGTEQFIPSVSQACNSGLMGMEVAWKIFGAKKIILLGFDMSGTHYFGKHPDCLKTTTERHFAIHRRQFENWNGPPVINCTPRSSLTKFPFMDLSTVL